MTNPYEPSELDSSIKDLTQGSIRAKRGPTLYIAGFGLLGGVASFPLLAMQNVLGFGLVLLGSPIGGIVYRVRSQRWPHYPAIPSKQFLYASLAVALPPAILFLLIGRSGQGIGLTIIALTVGISVASGILISGPRRLNAPQENLETRDAASAVHSE